LNRLQKKFHLWGTIRRYHESWWIF